MREAHKNLSMGTCEYACGVWNSVNPFLALGNSVLNACCTSKLTILMKSGILYLLHS